MAVAAAGHRRPDAGSAVGVLADRAKVPVRRELWWGLGVATLVGGLLRFPFLSSGSFWGDEIFTRWVVAQHSLTAIWDQVRKTESTPPLYYLAAKLSSDVWGNAGPFALRLPAAIALTAAVPVSFLAFRRLIGPPAALAAAAFVAVNPLLVSYGADARSYGMLVLFGLLSIWAFTALLEAPSGRRWALWALAGAAGLWTHYFIAYLLLGELVVLGLTLTGRRRHLLIATGALVLLSGALVPLVIHQAGQGMNAYIGRSSWTGRLESTVRQFAMGANVPRTWLEALGLLLVYGALLHGVWLRRLDRGVWVLLLLGLAGVGLPLLSAILGVEDKFDLRNVMIGVPLLGALLAPALLTLRRAVGAVVLGVLIVTGLWVATDWRYGQPDWKGAIATTPTRELRGTVVVAFDQTYPGSVVGTYLGRRRSTGAVTTTRLLLMVSSGRPAHHRDLVAVPPPAALTRELSAFTAVSTRIYRGMTLVEMRSTRPVTLTPQGLASGILWAPAAPRVNPDVRLIHQRRGPSQPAR